MHEPSVSDHVINDLKIFLEAEFVWVEPIAPDSATRNNVSYHVSSVMSKV